MGCNQRYMNALPDSAWGDLKRELAKRFSDLADSQFALSMLRQTVQKKGDIIQLGTNLVLC